MQHITGYAGRLDVRIINYGEKAKGEYREAMFTNASNIEQGYCSITPMSAFLHTVTFYTFST
jgi:hypothetical protein